MPAGPRKKIDRNNLPEYARRIADLCGSTSRADFAAELGVSQMALSHWINGKNPPGSKLYLKLAKISKTDEQRRWFAEQARDETVGLAVEVLGKKHKGSGLVIPVLRDAAAAGTPRAIEEREHRCSVELPRSWFIGCGKIFGVPVNGTSMEPLLRSGYVVFVDMQKRSIDEFVGKMVLAREDNGVTVKMLQPSGTGFVLMPLNMVENSPLPFIPREHEVLGRVITWVGFPAV